MLFKLENPNMGQERLSLSTILIAICTTWLFYFNSTPVLSATFSNRVIKPSATWQYKREISIDNRGDKVSDAVIQIQFNNEEFDYTKVKAAGADIRFSTSSGKLSGAGLPYWIEQWNDNGVSRIWVKVPMLKAHSKAIIQMYYGNSDAQAVSNGNTTFLFFDDFENGDYSKQWTNVSVGEVVEQNGLLKLKETDGQDGIITANYIVTGKLIVRTCYQRGRADEHWTRAGVGGWNKWLCFGDHTDNAATGTNYVMMFDSASISSLKSAPLVKAANTVITDKWRRVAYWYDGKSLKGKQDDVTAEWPATNALSKLALRTLDNDSWDNFAYIAVSTYIGSEPVVTMGQQKTN